MLEPYPADLQAYVQRKIDSGEFSSVQEFAVQEARVYRELETRRDELQESVLSAIADLAAGNFLELGGDDELHKYADDVKRRGRDRLNAASLDS